MPAAAVAGISRAAVLRRRAAPVDAPGIPAPVVVMAHRRPHQHTDAERQRAGLHQRLRGIHRPLLDPARIHLHRRSVHHGRIVLRHIDHVGLGRFDDDGLCRRRYHGRAVIHHGIGGRPRHVGRFGRSRRGRVDHGRDPQVRGVFQVARLPGARAQQLDRVHHVGGVVDVGVTERRGPVDVAGHLVQHGGESGQRFDTDVPRLAGFGTLQRVAFQRWILAQPLVGGGDLLGIRGAGQHLAHQLVWKQRDRRHHLRQLLGGRRRVRRRLRGRGGSSGGSGGLRCRGLAGLVAASQHQQAQYQ